MSDAAQFTVGAERPYWEGLLDGKLRLQKCATCATWHWPAVWRCSACGSWEHAWADVAMHGEIYTWTRNWHAFGGIEDLAKPFVIAVVKLDGGGGARLVGIVDDNPSAVRIGASVTGHVATTPYAGSSVPAIRWTLT